LTSAEQMRQLCDVMRTMHRGGRTESKDGKQKRLVSHAWSSMGNLNYQDDNASRLPSRENFWPKA
ncbi:unnamed protein product, partial [Symbiodinium sp. CCMP2456]